MNIFEQLNKLNEEVEVEDKDIILDSIESLTRFTNADGKEIPDFCRFKAIQDNFGISDKELLDLAKDNGYNVFKIITENNSEFVIAHPDCSEEVIKEAVFDDETPIKVEKVEFKEVSEMIEKQPNIEYKGFTIEHSPMEMHYGDEKQDVDGWYIHSPYYLQSNPNKEKFFLPLFAEDEFGVVQNFKTAEEAKEYIDKWIVTKKGKIKLKGWKKDECHFEILPEYRKEKEVDEKLLKEYTTYWPGEKEYPVRWDWGEYDPHTGSFANGKTLDDVTPDDYPEEEDEEPSGWSEEYTNEETVEEGDEYKITKCDVVIHPFSKKQKDKVKPNKYVVYFRRYKQASNGGTYLDKEHWYEHGGGGYYYDTLERARKVVTDYGHELKEAFNPKDYSLRVDADGVNIFDIKSGEVVGHIDDAGNAIYDEPYKQYIKEDKPVEEDIEKHETLNPLLFEGNKLKPEIREAMQKIADAFVEDLKEDDINIKVNDVILVGSNCSYNYTKDSDLDIHIIADSSALECPKELVDKLYSAYRSIFNKNYDITIKGIPAEIYVELDTLGAAKSNGIYSIMKDEWLKEPVQQDIPDLDQEAFDALFSEWENRYFDLVGGQTIDEPDFVDTTDELGESKTIYGDDTQWDYYEIYCEKGEEIEYSNDNFSLCIKVKHGTPTPEEEDVEEFFKENYPEVIKDYHVVGVWDTINDFADDELSLGDFENVYTYTAPVLASNSGELNESLFDDIDKFITDVYDLRKTSISKEGEYGLGNLVFKELRNLGYLDNLKELKKQERAKQLSLEQLGESSGQSKKIKRVKGVLFGNEDRHHTFCVMTPENPMNKNFSDKDNLPLIKEFRQGLRDDSITFTPISGKYGNKERSFFLYDITLEKSKELAKKYGQESFFFGKVNKDDNATVQFWKRSDEDSDYKMIEENDKIDINQERDNYYSIVGNKFKFSFDMDCFK